MRGAVFGTLAGIGAVAAAGVGFIRYRLRGIPPPVTGVFPNGMAYARLGAGPKTCLFLRGGPGNVVPMGPVFRAFSVDILRPFLESGYSVWVVTRRQNMPRGHSIEDMAVDHAAFLIVDEFDGKVDLVIGEEAYGGMIAFCLAARHPDLFDHVAVWLAGHRLSEEGKELELGFGRLMAEGRTGDAGALLVRALMPGLRVPGVDRIFGAVLVRMAFGTLHQYFRNDVLVEAEAVAAFDGRQILPKIQVPVLLIGCDQDLEITREIFEETAELISDCTLLIYEGMNGFQAVNDKRLPMDVLHWAEPSIGGATP